jgi:hypothetical protein
MSSLSDKVAKAAPLLVVSPGKTVIGNNADFIWACLRELGITDDDMSHEILLSADTREGDARAVFCDKNGVPVPRFRRIWSILREGAVSEQTTGGAPTGDLKSLVDAVRPIGQRSDEELLALYGVDCSSEIEKELRERTKSHNCIVFRKNGTKQEVDQAISMRLMKEARRRQVDPSYHDGDKVYRVYPIGEFPEQVYTMCPVTGKLLTDGYSDGLGFKWDMDYAGMVFVNLIHKAGIQITPITARDIQNEWKAKGLDGLKSMFPKVAKTYEDLDEIGELPSLHTRLNGREAGRQDPFGGGGKRF